MKVKNRSKTPEKVPVPDYTVRNTHGKEECRCQKSLNDRQ